MKNTDDKPRESGLDALLEGKLPAAAARRLRRQLARELRRLKGEIRDRMERSGGGIPGIEVAPASLRQKLRDIPNQRINLFRLAMPGGVFASVIVLMLALLVVQQRMPPDDAPTQAEIEQARAELVVAFRYIREISNRSGEYMKREIGNTVQDVLNERIFSGVTDEKKGG